MIELITLIRGMGIFFAIIGFLRGWNRELVTSVGVVLVTFVLFQTDGFLRTLFFFVLDTQTVFFIQAAIFVGFMIFIYRAEDLGGATERDEDDYQAGALGAVIGFVNGYLIGGTLWYLLDINEYPFERYVTAPALGSPSAEALQQIPIVFLGGGTSGTGNLLAVGVLIVLFIVLVVL